MSNHAHPRRTFVRLKVAATMLSLFALLLVAPVGELRWRPPAPIVPWVASEPPIVSHPSACSAVRIRLMCRPSR